MEEGSYIQKNNYNTMSNEQAATLERPVTGM
jgi:hypothetical protein